MSELGDRAQRVVGRWPTGGCVVGVLPDGSDPEWSGRAVLELIDGADGDRDPRVVLDLAPEETDLASRFDADGGPGLADVAGGDVEPSEIAHRDEARGIVYLSRGSRASGSGVAEFEAAESLAEQVRGEDGLLIVVLDPSGAEAAASAGYLDGFVRIGDAADREPPGGVAELEHLPARPAGRSRVPGRPDAPRLVLTPEMRSSHRRERRIRRVLLALAILVAVGLLVSAILGGPGAGAVGKVGDLLSGPGDRAGATAPVSAGRGVPSAASTSASDSSTPEEASEGEA